MSDYPMLISNKLHSFRNFMSAKLQIKLIPYTRFRCKVAFFFFAHSFAGKFLYITHRDNFFLRVLYFFPGVLSGFRYNLFFTFTLGHLYQINTGTNKNNRRQLRP